jgi:hypothetical protein
MIPKANPSTNANELGIKSAMLNKSFLPGKVQTIFTQKYISIKNDPIDSQGIFANFDVLEYTLSISFPPSALTHNLNMYRILLPFSP